MADDVRIRFGADNAQVLQSVERVKVAVAGLKGAVSSGLGAVGIGLGGAALIGYLKTVAQEIDNLNRRATQLRTSVEAVQRMEFVAKMNDTEIDIVANALLFLDKTLGDLAGNTGAGDALKRLNIEAEAFRKMDVDERLYALSDAYVSATDKGEAFADLNELLGRQGRELLPLLGQGGDALRALGEELDVVTGRDVAQVAKMNDAFDKLALTLRNKVVSGILSAADASKKLFASFRAAGQLIGKGVDSEGFQRVINEAADKFSEIEGFESGRLNNAVSLHDEKERELKTQDAITQALEESADAAEQAQFLAAQQVEILDQQLEAGRRLAEEKAEAFAMEIAALDAIGEADQLRTAELRKQSDEQKRLQDLMNAAPYSDLRRIGGGYRNETLGPVAGASGAGGEGGLGRSGEAIERNTQRTAAAVEATRVDAAARTEQAGDVDRSAPDFSRLANLSESIERNTQKTAAAVQRVAAATSYSPEQDLRALLGVGREVVQAVEAVEARLADGLIVEATIE